MYVWVSGFVDLIKLTFFLGNSNNSMAMVKLINLLLRIHNTQEKDSYIVLKVQGLVETVLYITTTEEDIGHHNQIWNYL